MNSTERQADTRTLRDYVGLAASGFAMGAANIVPGVSGGTLALILGIYEELITSIKDVLNPKAIKLALRFQVKEALNLLPWKFLASIAIGILLASLSMSFFLEWVLNHYPSLLWAFFFGLVAASVWTVAKMVKQWGIAPIASAVIGAVGAYLVVGMVPAETPDTWWFWFLSGMIAICAMVLPGVSGAFILVLLGKYQDLLAAVTNGQIGILLLVIAGAGVGIVTFAQVLSWLFKRYHDATVAFLMGMLLSSLRKVWPWKETVEYILDRHGEQMPIKQVNVAPFGPAWQTAVAILLALVGFALIFGLNVWAARRKKHEP
jgi:putative membrane protein